jgi:hypothetical protein
VSVAWSPARGPGGSDRARLATSNLRDGDWSRTGLRLWDGETGQELLHLPGYFGAARWSTHGWRLECDRIVWDATPEAPR